MDALYELKKDINIPNRYIRAGEQKTKEEWEKLFPNSFKFGEQEWFIKLPELKREINQNDLIRQVVCQVFATRGLYSLSYIDAAIVAVEEYIKIFTK